MKKLSDEDVINIRLAVINGTKNKKLAEAYGVCEHTIARIMRKKGRYKNII